VHCDDTSGIKTSTKKFDFSPDQTADDVNGQAESFRWVNFEDVNEDTMSLPIDKVAIQLLKEKFSL